MKSLSAVVRVDGDKCVNCHRCISVCPVKFCNDASRDHITIREDLCIGCGACIEACQHHARVGVDDTADFLKDLAAGVPLAVIVAPGVAASFPGTYLNLNGWLREQGARRVLDVSFGAELTIHSYLEYLQGNPTSTVIAQPCPAIVSFVEIYHPELIPFMAPVDSPMGHTVKMLKTFYPEYRDIRVAALSPCLAKKREFEATGLVDYNVTLRALQSHLEASGVDLHRYSPQPYDGPLAERAVLFPSPGGLLETARRDLPGLALRTRRMEGSIIYRYLEGLESAIEKGVAPLLVDCLSCELGCSGGPGTPMVGAHPDEVDYPIRERSQQHQEMYAERGRSQGTSSRRVLMEELIRHWQPELYRREYEDRSSTFDLIHPSQEDLEQIYLMMHKFEPRDHYHCAACGYNHCEDMAVAIHNGLNKKEHCHHYYFIMNQ